MDFAVSCITELAAAAPHSICSHNIAIHRLDCSDLLFGFSIAHIAHFDHRIDRYLVVTEVDVDGKLVIVETTENAVFGVILIAVKIVHINSLVVIVEVH
jgi:hypothetical protein